MAKKKITQGVHRCVGGFVTIIDGRKVSVRDGAVVPYDVGYEVLDGREHLFVDLSVPRTQVRRVEQATAAPAEVRNTEPPSTADDETSDDEGA